MDERGLVTTARMQGGVVTTAQILERGLSRPGIQHRVQSFRLFPIRRGAFTLSPVQGPTAHLWAALLTSGPDRAMVSHGSAALVHGMSKVRPTRIHVTVPGTGGRSAPGLHIHRSRTVRGDDITSIDGLRVTSPARTVLDIAALADDRVVLRLIREGEYQRLLPAGAMLETVRAHPHHPGAAAVRRVDPMTVDAALEQTPLEDELELLIRTLPLPPFERQVVLHGVSGASYRIDFGWPSMRLAVEADSRPAHERTTSLESDRFRDNDLAASGWLTLRFTSAQLRQGRESAGRQVVATAMRRGWGTPEPVEHAMRR